MNNQRNTNNLDNTSPATMIASMVGYIVGLAGMDLLGIGSLFFVKLLVDSVLVFIPSIVAEKNPWNELTVIMSLNKIMYSFFSVALGTVLRKVSSYLCSQETLRIIDNFFYRN
jgi:hypothetical protein